MPFANNAGTLIHYEVEGTGPALVLQHGFTQCLEDWSDYGYVAALRSQYRLILVDARGHGGSDKPHDAAAYTLDRRVADVTAVLDAVGVEKALFWGYSLGGWIGFGLAKYTPQRVDALVIGGADPFAYDRSSHRRWLRHGLSKGRDALVTAFESTNGPISKVYAARMHAADLDAWLASADDRAGVEDVLATMRMPCCLYAGEADPGFAQARRASEQIPSARFVSLPGLSHMQAFYESRLVLPKVTEFLTRTNKA